MSKIAYKLFRQMKDGSIKSLFINKKIALPFNQWLEAEEHKTPGFAFRPGWHCCSKMEAPHLSKKNRVWKRVEISDFEKIERPASQGGVWYLAKKIKILEK